MSCAPDYQIFNELRPVALEIRFTQMNFSIVAAHESGSVKGFGRRPLEGRRRAFGGRVPGSESLQGRCYAVDGGGEEGEDMAFIGADVNRWSTPCRS
jgi:hypothetical protein